MSAPINGGSGCDTLAVLIKPPMRTFTTIILALGFVGSLAGCEVETGGEPTVVEMRAKDKIPCGGFGGFPCPDDLVCVDDPADSCDPDNGGADCPGMCVKPRGKQDPTCDYSDPTRSYVGESPEECAVIKFVCAEGSHYFADDCGCGCELD